ASDGLTPPAYYMGGGKFTVSSMTGTGFGGSVRGGAAAYGPGELTVQFPLVMDQPPLNAHLIAASVTGTITMTSISNGKLCRAIPADERKMNTLPQVAALLWGQVKKGASPADPIASLFDTDKSCPSTSANSDPTCAPTATGPCHCISESEVENNSIIKSL